FSDNGDNAASNITATFTQAGTYSFQATVSNLAGLSTTSSVNVTVNQTLTKISVSPASASVVSGGTQQFSASGFDQFGRAMSVAPTFAWSNTGAGSVDSSGLYTASYAAGSDTVTATSNSVSGHADVTVTNSAPTVATAAAANPSPVTATTTN